MSLRGLIIRGRMIAYKTKINLSYQIFVSKILCMHLNICDIPLTGLRHLYMCVHYENMPM